MKAPLANDLEYDHLPEPVTIPMHGGVHQGILTMPPDPHGVVLFAHGSGSSRLSGRNRFVADMLVKARFGTLLFDLLTEWEAGDRRNVFDIPLLAGRLRQATDWLVGRAGCAHLPIGYFGASTGAAAALVAAGATTGPGVSAVVSRGGRPDLAGDALAHVYAPTLLIVGGDDDEVLALNRHALAQLPGVNELVVIPGATHLFEERGALEAVADHASAWFAQYLGAPVAGGVR